MLTGLLGASLNAMVSGLAGAGFIRQEPVLPHGKARSGRSGKDPQAPRPKSNYKARSTPGGPDLRHDKYLHAHARRRRREAWVAAGGLMSEYPYDKPGYYHHG